MAASGFRPLSGYAGAMPKLAANLSMLFVEVDVSRALRRRGASRIPRGRVPVPLRLAAGDIAAAARDARVEVLLHNMPQGDAGSAASAAPPA